MKTNTNICLCAVSAGILALLCGGCERHETSETPPDRSEQQGDGKASQSTQDKPAPPPEPQSKPAEPQSKPPEPQSKPPEPQSKPPGGETGRSAQNAPPAAPSKAVAELLPTQDNTAKGTVTFRAEGDGVRVIAEITGLSPGEHGIHIHEKGDCSAPDAASAGEHFNPTGKPHGGPDAEQQHVGDMGNITANDRGEARLDRVFPFLSLSGANSIVGRAVIVHANRDDLNSQPSGNAGARLACGVIQADQR